MMRYRNFISKGGAVFFLFLSIAFLVSCNRPKDPIKIGLCINLSGRGGTAGEYIRDGVLLAVEDVNAAGGINGRPLKLLVEDDKNTKEGILAADGRLIDQGAIAIIGHSYSQNTLIAYPYVMSKNVLLFTPYTATTKLSGIDDMFCRTAVDNSLYGRSLAKLLSTWQINNIAVLMDMSNPSFVEDYLDHTAKHFSGSIHSVRFNSKARKTDWDIIIADLLQPDPQAAILLTEVTMTGLSAQKLRGKGFSGKLVASLWAQTPDLMRYGGKAVEGLSLVTFIDPDNNGPAYKRFEKSVLEKFQTPATARSTRAYEAVQILAQALRHCPPSPTAADLKTALQKYQFETLMGTVQFDEYCDVSRPIYEIRVGKNGFYNAGTILP